MKSVMHEGQSIFPSKIVCVGRNYLDHIHELKNEIPEHMVLFIKPNSSISDQLQSFIQEPIHYETELCFLYQQEKFTAVAVGLDLTKRALQSNLKAKGLPWERAKAFNASALFSPFVSISEISTDLSLQLLINGKCQQTSSITSMIYQPTAILKEIKSFIDLEDGDIVMTGTPSGVGAVTEGDIFHASVLCGGNTLIEQVWHAR